MKQHYFVRFKLNTRSGWLIWYTNSKDGVELSQGRLMAFKSLELAIQYLNRKRKSGTIENRTIYNFNYKMLEATIDCDSVLNIFNLIEDIYSSLKCPFEALSDAVYDKLFHGCNLPSINQSGIKYTPTFSKVELKELNDKLMSARKILVSRICWIS